MSKSSALPVSVLLIFEVQLIKGPLFFKTRFLLYLSLSSAPSTVIQNNSPLTTIYASL